MIGFGGIDLELTHRGFYNDLIFLESKSGVFIDLQTYFVRVGSGSQYPIKFQGVVAEIDMNIDFGVYVFEDNSGTGLNLGFPKLRIVAQVKVFIPGCWF